MAQEGSCKLGADSGKSLQYEEFPPQRTFRPVTASGQFEDIEPLHLLCYESEYEQGFFRASADQQRLAPRHGERDARAQDGVGVQLQQRRFARSFQ